MKTATRADKELVVDILAKSFKANQSIKYIVKQDEKSAIRIRNLMDYSFEMCYLYGEVILSDDEKGCALILYPQKKKVSLKSIMLDVKLVFVSVGLKNLGKTLSRESLIKKIQPKEDMLYLWFIGTEPSEQNKGIGSTLLRSVLQRAADLHKPIYLETSTLRNLPWYQKYGFELYNKYDLGYQLYFLRRLFKQ